MVNAMVDEAPIFTVLMAVYNGVEHLEEALLSIRGQSFSSFEFLIVNDCSTDETLKLLEQHGREDPRIRIISNEINLGLASSLNKGIRSSRGKYIARMDGDDIAHVDRLRIQYDYLESNPKVSICCSGAQYIGHEEGIVLPPLKHEVFRAALLFANPVFHPSVVFRRSHLAGLEYVYEENRRRVEDLELWQRASRVLTFGGIRLPLIKYRTYNPASVLKRNEVVRQGNLIRWETLSLLLGDVSEEDFSLHMKVSKCHRNSDPVFLLQAANWLERLLQENMKSGVYDQESLLEVVENRWWRVCKSSVEIGPSSFFNYISRKILRRRFRFKRDVPFFLKSLVFYRNHRSCIHSADNEYVYKVSLQEGREEFFH